MPFHRPVHPGEILREFISGDVTITSLAKHIDYPRVNLSRVVNGRLGIAPVLAVKLSEAFPNQNAEFWMNLQNSYELALIRKSRRKKIQPISISPSLERATA